MQWPNQGLCTILPQTKNKVSYELWFCVILEQKSLMENITQLPVWQSLIKHQKTIATQHMRNWFARDPLRFEKFSLTFNGLLLDYSKNRITEETLPLLITLATSTDLKEKIKQLFQGEMINRSEKRAALHTALRSPKSKTIIQNGKNITADIHAVLEKMRAFIQKVHDKTWLGATGKPIQTIVNIGIGGSHLGPQMATHALKDFAVSDLTCHFISNIDNAHLQETLKQINPETTLFIISSKSFSTLETITHATTLKTWLQQKLNSELASQKVCLQQKCDEVVSQHFIAVTTAEDAAFAFGIPKENIFSLWDWVGGRYSIWSAIGLPLALIIGMDAFSNFLAGAHAMDEHFQHADFSQNMPVIMALLGIWYINFFGSSHQAIIPYSHHLQYLRTHLQQLDMESNGKCTSQHGNSIDFLTGPVLLGEQGCNGQHAFHQLLHQGQHLIPVDFILVGKNNNNDFPFHHDILISSGLSQAQALMYGKTFEEAVSELQLAGYSKEESAWLAQHKMIPGNRPSNVLFLKEMNPYHLGMLLALYEHKTFVQGAIWGINSFDQWGVELGKHLLPNILKHLQNETSGPHAFDSSTEGLIKHYKNLQIYMSPPK